MFNATNSNAIISKSKNITSIFFCVSGMYLKFWILWKKQASEVICFWNYRMQKGGLLKSLKSLDLEHWWTVKILKCPKHYFNLLGSIFVMFLGHSKKISSKNFFSVVSEILTLFVSILTLDVFYLCKGQCLKEPIQNEIISKLKNTFWFFFWIS